MRLHNIRIRDLKTALDESRQNEKRYVYPYPENDLEETKVLDKELEPLKKETPKKKKTKEIEDEEDFLDEKKKGNKTLIIVASIFTALVLTVTIALFLLILLAASLAYEWTQKGLEWAEYDN